MIGIIRHLRILYETIRCKLIFDASWYEAYFIVRNAPKFNKTRVCMKPTETEYDNLVRLA